MSLYYLRDMIRVERNQGRESRNLKERANGDLPYRHTWAQLFVHGLYAQGALISVLGSSFEVQRRSERH